MRKSRLAAVAVLIAGWALAFADAEAQPTVGTYESNLVAYARACNRSAFDHDLMNLRALAQIRDQRLQNTNASTAQGLKGKGLSDDQVLRQMDRDRNTSGTQLHTDYWSAVGAHQAINAAPGIWDEYCRPAERTTGPVPPRKHPGGLAGGPGRACA